MKLELDELKNRWKDARSSSGSNAEDTQKVIEAAEERRKYALYHQYGNVAILTATLAMVIYFFYYLFPFGDFLSRMGTGFMSVGLIVRIVAELYSIRRSRRIKVTDSALKTTNETLNYYRLRKLLNGPVTIGLVMLYIAGIFLFVPEVLKYVAIEWVVLFAFLFVVGACVLIWQIRKGILSEMRKLKEMVDLRNELLEKND